MKRRRLMRHSKANLSSGPKITRPITARRNIIVTITIVNTPTSIKSQRSMDIIIIIAATLNVNIQRAMVSHPVFHWLSFIDPLEGSKICG